MTSPILLEMSGSAQHTILQPTAMTDPHTYVCLGGVTQLSFIISTPINPPFLLPIRIPLSPLGRPWFKVNHTFAYLEGLYAIINEKQVSLSSAVATFFWHRFSDKLHYAKKAARSSHILDYTRIRCLLPCFCRGKMQHDKVGFGAGIRTVRGCFAACAAVQLYSQRYPPSPLPPSTEHYPRTRRRWLLCLFPNIRRPSCCLFLALGPRAFHYYRDVP